MDSEPGSLRKTQSANHVSNYDQSTFYTDLKNTTFQENANEAIHRFIK